MADTTVNPYGTPPAAGAEGKKKINAVYDNEKDKGVSVDDFLNLMVAQMQNQDPMNPMEDTQYVTQLAQFATMQQMQELAYYSKTNFVMSLVGKEVTVAQYTVSGEVKSFTGPVEKVTLDNNSYKIYVDNKAFDLSQVMEIFPPASGDSTGEGDVIKDLGLALVETTPTTATLTWEIPTLEENPERDRLRYSVYYSTNSQFDSVADVKKYGKLAGDPEQLGVQEITIEKLEPGTTYYVNVIVKDIHGKESVYVKQAVVTPNQKPEEV